MYSLKIEHLFNINEATLHLTARELQGLQQFNQFVVCVYIQLWYTSHSAANATVNNIHLLQRLNGYKDVALQNVGLNIMLRHSWYLSPEQATLVLF